LTARAVPAPRDAGHGPAQEPPACSRLSLLHTLVGGSL